MKSRLPFISLLFLISISSFAEDANMSLNPTVVTATRVETNSFDVPVSIDVVSKDNIQDAQLGMTLSESLIRVPGLTAQNRTQLSQDPQISTRGFGARSAFGVRGIRVFVDGIPLTMPDGIAQPGNIDLDTIQSIEVMRGPFSTMYGSSSGGVIQLMTQDSPKTPELKFDFMAGSYGMRKESTQLSGTLNNVQYLFGFSNFATDGYRDHSKAWKNQATGQLKFKLDNGTRATLLVNYADSRAQDPLGLARTDGVDKKKNLATDEVTDTPNKYYSAFTNPKAAPDVASTANTRVARTNTQVGLHLDHDINNNNTLAFIGSVGDRDNLQYLALPITCTNNTTCGSSPPTYSLSRGRASSIQRSFWSSEINWLNHGEIFQKKYSIVTGINYGSMKDKRMDINASAGQVLDYAAFNKLYNPDGSDHTDPYGNINRNERDIATNFDQFIQAKLSTTENTDIHAGVRHSKVEMTFKGNAEVAAGTNINGSSSFEKTTPMVGATWKATPTTNLYANYGKGFETPTLIEMAYASQSAPSTGPNVILKPSTSDNFEVGLKSFVTPNTRVNLALFRTDTKQEIIISQNSTYTVYGNAAKTKRQGLEMSVDSQLAHNINLYGAYTYLDATFDERYQSGITAGTDGYVNSGYKIPGTYKQQLYGEIAWKYPELNFKTALEGRANSKVYINDVNSDFAPGYAIANLRAGFEQNVSNFRLTEYMRIENIFDKNYIGSVRINDNNNRNFEPAPSRNYMVGVSATYRF